MTILQSIILGAIQGFTEFLPISSSGHLVFAQSLLHVENAEIFSFDVYVHFGTLISIFIALWKDIRDILKNTWDALSQADRRKSFRENAQFRLGLFILVGTIPAGVIGILFREPIKHTFSDPKFVAMNLVITGLFLFLTRLAKPVEGKKIGIMFAIIVGLAQALAILPGISRSGTTMSTAMYLRMPAVQAARFSFLLAIPVIAGAAILESRQFFQQGFAVGFAPIIVGTVVAAITGYVAIKIMFRIMEKGIFSYFSVYCIALGILGIIFI